VKQQLAVIHPAPAIPHTVGPDPALMMSFTFSANAFIKNGLDITSIPSPSRPPPLMKPYE
jgi:hypothetical protein